jgi:hypothetical protein
MAQYSRAYVDPTINLDEENIQLSQAMNKLIIDKIKEIKPTKFPLTKQQIVAIRDKEIKLFKDQLTTLKTQQPKSKYPVKRITGKIEPHSLGATLAAKIGDRVDNIIKVINNATEEEIKAKGKFILYRGTKHAQDSLTGSGGFPISYNTGLFAGSVYDYEGNTFTPLFMIEGTSGYCLTIPYEDMIKQEFPFHIPVGNSLKQLFGHDQPYHAWTKVTPSILDPMGQIPPESHLNYSRYYVDDLNRLEQQYQVYINKKIQIYP